MTQLPTPSLTGSTVPSPPTRGKLELQLANGPELIDAVQRNIDRWKLPYRIEVSDGTVIGTDGKIVPKDFGILRDTLSRGEIHLQSFITVEPSTLQMKEDAKRMATTSYEVLVCGPTGTGKEIIAKSMVGARKGEIKFVNCAGLPSELVESELFGYVSGAFTGAQKTKDGMMTAARDGVMFLDEIGELPLSVQAKLLRALQEKRIRKVGSLVEEDITCKFVCATHRNLKKMVQAGTFREDLYARISTLELDIKPLWPERKLDIIPITEAVMESCKISTTTRKRFLESHGKDLQDGTLDVPLNVRSIQQYVIRFDCLGRIK